MHLLLFLSSMSGCKRGVVGDDTSTPGLDDTDTVGDQVEILRDRWGIPHVYADSWEGAWYGAGYTAGEEIAPNVILDILIAEGRVAEVGGPAFIDDDARARAFAHEAVAERDYDDLDVESRQALEAFAAGFNEAASQLSSRWEPYPEVAANLPIDGEEIASAILASTVNDALATMSGVSTDLDLGSNAAAIAGTNTRSGSPMVYGDPHVSWSDAQRLLHIQTPEIRLFFSPGTAGITVAGGLATGPLAGAGTRNFPQAVVAYALELSDDKTHYYDPASDAFEPLEVIDETVAVAGKGTEEITYYRTRLGPVTWDDGPIALAVTTAGRLQVVDEYFRIARATSADEIHDALREPDRAMRTAMVGDGNSGEISFYWTGRVAALEHDDVYDYTEVVPLNSETDWSGGVHVFDEEDPFPLPFARNPAGGWVQNSNDPPRYATPAGELAGPWPERVVPSSMDLGARGERLRQLLDSTTEHDLETLRGIAFDVHSPYAKRLIEALDRGWDRWGDQLESREVPDDVLHLDQVLRDWDANATIDAQGMSVLFHLRRTIDIPWPGDDYEPSANELEAYLRALATVATTMRGLYGTDNGVVRVPTWGEIHVLERDGVVVPLPGGTKDIQTLFMAHDRTEQLDKRPVDAMDADGIIRCSAGSSWVHLHDLTPDAMESWSIRPHGQLSPAYFPGAPHTTDQAMLLSKSEMVPLLTNREDVVEALTPYEGQDDYPLVARRELEVMLP